MAGKPTYRELEEKVRNLESEMVQVRQEGEERFRAVFDSSRDSIFIKNSDLVYTLVNPGMRKHFALSYSNIIGKKDADLYGPDMCGHLMEIDRKVLNGETVEEEHSRQVNGNRNVFHVIRVPLRDSRGTVTGLCGIVRNITERKQLEKELREKESELRDQARNLEKMNTALKVLIDHRDDEKRRAREDIVAKAKKLVFPYLDKMEQGMTGDEIQTYLRIIRLNIQELIASYMNEDSHQYRALTPTEIQVVDLVKQGKTSKEIASIMNVSLPAVSFHRANVRKKLGLLHAKTNLMTYLQSGFRAV